MVDEPEEFVNIALDTVDKQNSEVPKTAAASLLEAFCDHVDGCTSFIGQLCVLIINQSIEQIGLGNDIFTDDPSSPYYLLKSISNRFFFQKMNRYERIDVCLMALTVMSYLLSRRLDLIAMIEQMLRVNIQFFQNPDLHPVIRVRLCLFLGYYCDNLFKSNEDLTSLLDYILVIILLYYFGIFVF